MLDIFKQICIYKLKVVTGAEVCAAFSINHRIYSRVVRDFIFPVSEELIFWTCESRNNSTRFENLY